MMLRARPDKAASMVKCLRGLRAARSVRILEKYIVFGKYDAVLLLDCADSAQATEFALRIASEAHCTTETFVATRIEDVRMSPWRE